MTQQRPPDPVGDFILAHRDRFTLEEIGARLREAGHSPEAVEAAIERVQAADRGASPAAPAAQAGLGARRVAKVLVLATLGLAGYFLVSVAASFSWIVSEAPAGPALLPLFIGAGNIAILVLIALGLFRPIDRARSGRLVWIVLLTVLVLAPLATLGLCTATILLTTFG